MTTSVSWSSVGLEVLISSINFSICIMMGLQHMLKMMQIAGYKGKNPRLKARKLWHRVGPTTFYWCDFEQVTHHFCALVSSSVNGYIIWLFPISLPESTIIYNDFKIKILLLFYIKVYLIIQMWQFRFELHELFVIWWVWWLFLWKHLLLLL